MCSFLQSPAALSRVPQKVTMTRPVSLSGAFWYQHCSSATRRFGHCPYPADLPQEVTMCSLSPQKLRSHTGPEKQHTWITLAHTCQSTSEVCNQHKSSVSRPQKLRCVLRPRKVTFISRLGKQRPLTAPTRSFRYAILWPISALRTNPQPRPPESYVIPPARCDTTPGSDVNPPERYVILRNSLIIKSFICTNLEFSEFEFLRL